jgi:dolichyl-phosphate-mannose-protein mannosyltransferase
MRHFSWRAMCLIFLPLVLYMYFFYLHFAILTKSGPGDAFMSVAFQSTLQGNDITSSSTAVPFNSVVTMRHKANRAFLHSHPDRYPLRYDDARVSSEGQQVTCYSHVDANNDFIIEPVSKDKYEAAPELKLTSEERARGVRYLRNGDLVRLLHRSTKSYLLTHDVASPLTNTNMEVTTIDPEAADKRYPETVWRIDVAKEKEGEKVFSRRTVVRFVNAKHKVAVNANKKNLPKWGFEQVEVNGEKNPNVESCQWRIDTVVHERIVDGVELGQSAADVPKQRKMPFVAKFLELQAAMLSHNAGLTSEHPYASSPITWPFLTRGISFWESKEGLRQIYLIGNPLAWWLVILVTLSFAVLWVVDRILLRRGIDDLGLPMRRWWDRAVGWMFITWLCHWLPFFLMGRQLFLHHYLPSYIISVMITG